MPLYEYTCDQCGTTFEIRRKVAERTDPAACPQCGDERSHYQFSVPAALPVVGAAVSSGDSCGPGGCCGGACGI